MLKAYNLIIVFLFGCLICCNDNPVEPEKASAFFPNSIGNKWYYQHYRISNDSIIITNPDKDFDVTFQIVGSNVINRKIYSIVEERYFDSFILRIDTCYYRAEAENLYRLKKDRESNKYFGDLLAKFSLAAGDTFHYYWNDDHKYIATIKERKTDLIRIYYDIPEFADDEFEIIFRRYVGIENRENPAFSNGIKLVKAEMK